MSLSLTMSAAIQMTCPKCSRRHLLSEEEAYLFYPRFYCLGCGEKMAIPISKEEYVRLAHRSDRDHRIPRDGQPRHA